MRPSQIRLACSTLMAAALCCGPALAHERPTTTPAARFLDDNLGRALLLAHPPVSTKASGELDIVIRDAMDWPSLTQFAIGRYGADLTEGGRSDAAARLERQLGILARRAGRELPTLTIAIHDMRIGADGSRRLLSTATVPRFGEVEVAWTLVPTATGYRITDIAAFGLTLRQFLRSWVIGLIAAQGGNAAAVFNDAAAASPQ